MHINKKIRPPLSDGERISRLEQKTRFQSVVILLLEVNVLVLSWRMYSSINTLLLAIQSVSDHINIVDQQMNSVCEILQKLISAFA